MTTARFREMLREVTAEVLARMSNSRHVDTEQKELPFWPTTYDINCGWCEDWGRRVEARVPQASGVWLEEPSGDDHSHYAIHFRSMWYDAECPEGVEDFHDLP